MAVQLANLSASEISIGPSETECTLPLSHLREGCDEISDLASSDSILQPLSANFVDFLSRWLDDQRFEGQRWVNQISEALNSNIELRLSSEAKLERLITNEKAQTAIRRVYDWFICLCSSRGNHLTELHRNFKFIAVVGAPRTGGSYLTAELFRALGHDPSAVHSALAHDGFPDAQPFSALAPGNDWIHSLATMSEYLTMVEMFFSGAQSAQKIVVPKKVTKAVYAAGLFRKIFGIDAEFLVTIRNPIASCVSTYDKSGGMPADGKFTIRSAIERWVLRDVAYTGINARGVRRMNYFEAYLLYWELYYTNLALSGIGKARYSIIPYGRDSMHATAKHFYSKYSSASEVSEFVVGRSGSEKHPEWVAEAKKAMERVAAVWRLVGMPFPMAELDRCY